MYTAAAVLTASAALWYAAGRRYCRCDTGGDAQGRLEMLFVVVFEAPAYIVGGGGLLLFALAFPCQGAEPNVSAKAAVALAAARQKARPPQAVPVKAAPGCLCNGGCRCGRGECRCSPAGACSKECGCGEVMHPRTKRADDGGPDWTYDPARKGYYRTLPAPAVVPTPAPVFQAPAFTPPPASFRPPVMMGGGGACRGGG